MPNMKEMLSKKPFLTTVVALFVFYAFFYMGVSSLLFGVAIGLISVGLEVKMEIAVAVMILSGLLYPVIVGLFRRREGFTAPAEDSVMVTQQGPVTQIIKRIQGMQGAPGVQGVLSASFAEGFADVNSDAGAGSDGKLKKDEETSAGDKPASVTETSVSQVLQQTLDAQKSVPAVAAEVKKDAPKTTSGFQNGKAGEFKLGQIPTELEGGVHIDAGTTLMNALKGLNPDQVKAMTEDTQKLMETQKSLMGMLNTMKPMLSDGKQLLDTFNDMFGKQ
jgi:hypothetical protein